MEIWFWRVLAGAVLTLVGYLHVRQNKLENRLEEKAEKAELDKIEKDVKEVLKQTTDIRVAQAECLVEIRNLRSNS